MQHFLSRLHMYCFVRCFTIIRFDPEGNSFSMSIQWAKSLLSPLHMYRLAFANDLELTYVHMYYVHGKMYAPMESGLEVNVWTNIYSLSYRQKYKMFLGICIFYQWAWVVEMRHIFQRPQEVKILLGVNLEPKGELWSLGDFSSLSPPQRWTITDV
jgi:hypothetical protein